MSPLLAPDGSALCEPTLIPTAVAPGLNVCVMLSAQGLDISTPASVKFRSGTVRTRVVPVVMALTSNLICLVESMLSLTIEVPSEKGGARAEPHEGRPPERVRKEP